MSKTISTTGTPPDIDGRVATRAESLSQRIRSAFRFRLGEWFLNENAGFDYDLVLNHQISSAHTTQILLNVIRQEGGEEITNIRDIVGRYMAGGADVLLLLHHRYHIRLQHRPLGGVHLMSDIFIVDGSGARAGSLAVARRRFDNANRAVFGDDIDDAPHAPQNQIAGINALVWSELGEELVKVGLWGASIKHARGAFLDSLGSLLDLRRRQESFTRVTATITGTSGAVVAAGRFARTPAGDLFQTAQEVVIQEGGTQVEFVAVEAGPVPCAAGALSEIVSVQTGWDAVVNADAGVEGQDRESDALFRQVLLNHTAHSSVGALPSLRAAILSAGERRSRYSRTPPEANRRKAG